MKEERNMRHGNQIDLGSVKVHKLALAEVVAAALLDVDGVRLAEKTFSEQVMDLLGNPSYPGIDVHVESSGDVSIDVRIIVRYGLNIPDVARMVQDAVKTTVKKTMNTQLKDINVNIYGIERGAQ
jgi:uncharacterized alkaline shock family protein YloU